VKIGERTRRFGPDALAVASYTVFAVLMYAHLWRDPRGRILADNKQDEIFFEWVLSHAARVVTHGGSPIFTDALNAPVGVNLMANTSVLALAIPLSPVTLLFGPAVTFVLISTLSLAGTAIAWYFVLSRGLVESRAAAYVGALFCGFGPAMISQSTGHPNITGQFVIPLVVRAVFRLRLTEVSKWRRGLVLAGLVVLQCFINEEMLFLTALTLLIFLLVYLPPRELWPTVKAAAPAAGIAVLAALVVLAYPLYHQFAGAQSYRGLPGFVLDLSTDLAAFKDLSRRSIFGNPEAVSNLGGATEENTFFGWGLLILVVVAGVVLWRRRAARALFVTGVVFAVLSLGRTIRYQGEPTTHSGPWKFLAELPLFDSVVPTRLALVVTPLIGLLLALLLTAPRRLLWAFAAFVALFPLIPTPQPAIGRDPLPAVFANGDWRQYMPADATVVPVPGGWTEYLDAMAWATGAKLDIKIVGGYFLAPDLNRADKEAVFGPTPPPTMQLLDEVSAAGTVPLITDEQRTQARADIAYWHATTFVLSDRHGNGDQLRQTVDQLVGPGKHVADAWIWDVRSLT
jgi:hypothetical protein